MLYPAGTPTSLGRLLDSCRNGLGQPLSADARRRITDLDTDPNPLTWDAAYSLIIQARPVTLWQAVAAVDALCPRRLRLHSINDLDEAARWGGYCPSRLVLRIALRDAGHRTAA